MYNKHISATKKRTSQGLFNRNKSFLDFVVIEENKQQKPSIPHSTASEMKQQ